ncbi:hypothetical protein PsorP6_008286 [Peronosclerospora sorghi]|uniref:Uncharacterized protein n=1 Tax=Peronosclerospora sorghi TaxID=230839 RepID=A0ACC0WB88_9STRA|nr:hypothetical protein PsorP6_008286 [Peronosclerospora sorghi]
MTDSKLTVTAPTGFQLGGFFGRDGSEINLLGAIWTRIAPETAAPATPAPEPVIEEERASDEQDAASDEASAADGPRDEEQTEEADEEQTEEADEEQTEEANEEQTEEADEEQTEEADEEQTEEETSEEGSETAAPAEPAAPATEAPAPAPPAMTVQDSITQSEAFGGPHGTEFSDRNFANSGQVVKSVSIQAGKRLDGITIEIAAPRTMVHNHGGTGGDRKELQLGPGEHITSMELHSAQKNRHTRIFYINLVTSAGNSLSGGSMTDSRVTYTAPPGFQLVGFHGRSGDEIDMLGAVWAYIELVTPPPTVAPVLDPGVVPATVAPNDLAGDLSEIKVKPKKRPIQLSDSFGGPHGNHFSDQMAVTSGMVIASVTIRSGSRVDALTLVVKAPKEMEFRHGGWGGDDNTLILEPGEYITTIEAHSTQKNGHTRIGHVSFTTNKGRNVAGGDQTDSRMVMTAPEGYQLAGFFGRSGSEVDLLGAVWASIETVNETAFNMPAAVDDIVLSDLFGGPHGVAFSDINEVEFGQRISKVMIRAAERLDAVVLEILEPLPKNLAHGGGGGNQQELTLAPDETITSVEVHTGKKNDHTRVFYICLTTNKNQKLTGGSPTDNKFVATPPPGFVFGGFYGRAEGEVDQLGVIWMRQDAKKISLTDPTGVGNGTYGTTIRNWVGPTIFGAKDTACYRKLTPLNSQNTCPSGYWREDSDCMTQCPLSYPVECGVECIPQNNDCSANVLSKTASVLFVALNLATGNVFGSIRTVGKGVKWGIVCAKNVVEILRELSFYLRYRQKTAPMGTQAELLTAAYQANVVVFDLPITICSCLNIPTPTNAQYPEMVMSMVQGVVKQLVTNGDTVIESAENIQSLLTGHGLIPKDDSLKVSELEDIVASNSSCGFQLKRLTDRVIQAVLRYRSTGASQEDVRVLVYQSSIVLNDIPIVTNNCMGELLATKTKMVAYQTRDLLRKTFGVIVDQLIETGRTDEGKNVAENDYMLEMANLGLNVLSVVDPTGIAYMAAEFVQPICGPTAYVGEIDDGTLFNALGLLTVDEAFLGSYGTYTRAGDGVVHLIFESVDDKDVTVVIHSGGDEYAKVDVGAGGVTYWDGTFSELEDKTLYLDRWRPGVFGLPGSGGGSLLLWIPRSSEGGHITMHVRINPS